MLAWTPILPARAARSSVDDPPVAIFYDKAWSSPMTLSRWLSAQNPKDSSEVVVALTIDGRGRVSDFSLMHGEMTPGLANMILLNRFYPATRFGKPTSGTLVYTFSQVHVKG